MKVSFDFDGTLTLNAVQVFCEKLIAKKHEVWITTYRYDDANIAERARQNLPVFYNNERLYAVTDELMIPRRRIIFTNQTSKVPFLIGHNFAFHLDDDPFMIKDIAEILPHIIVNVLDTSWKRQCLKKLK